MTGRVFPVVAALVVTAVCVAGVVLFPRALEPGRSERSGIQLPPLTSSETTDWFPAAGVRIPERSDGVRFVGGPAAGNQLITRPLAIMADEPYEVVVDGFARGRAKVEVFDARVRRLFAAMELGPVRRRRTLRFRTGERHVSIVVETNPRVVVSLAPIELRNVQ